MVVCSVNFKYFHLAFWWCQERNKDQNLHKPGKDFSHAIQRYALRFLVYNTCTVQPAQADSPIILHRISDQNIQDMSWDTYLKEVDDTISALTCSFV